MYTFLLMFLDLVRNHNLHWFFFFFLFIIVRWAVVFFHAIRYKPYACSDEETEGLFSSVIIPVVDEPLDVFEQVCGRIAYQTPSEIIIVINGPRNQKLEEFCARYRRELTEQNGKRTELKCFYTPVAGKRNAIQVGVRHLSPESDITILVDSDTIWTKDTLRELLKPFVCDTQVGGVTTRQKIFRPERSLATMFANLLEEIRAEGSMKAMSVKGKVGCLPGRTIAFRTAILRDAMHEFMTEEFMGIHKEVSDDRSLTNLTLKAGYKTVMQDTSVVYTDAPVRWGKFIRQQLRWAEGSQYNNLYMTPWMWKNAKLMFFLYWTDILMPMILISVYANMLICFVLNRSGYPVGSVSYTENVWVTILLILVGSMLFFGARNIRVMSQLPWYYIPMIPLFIVILTLIMVPVRLVGLMRCADGLGWGTRDLKPADPPGGQ